MSKRLTARQSATSYALTAAVLAWTCFVPAVVRASLKIVTLSELVQKSDVIARGSLSATPSAGNKVGVASLKIVSVIKGKTDAAKGDIPLCNTDVDSEHPDLAKVVGDYVVFAVRKGECFHLVWGYDSLVAVRNGRASTAGIDDQPSDQPIEQFLERIRLLVRKKVHDPQ